MSIVMQEPDRQVLAVMDGPLPPEPPPTA